MRDERVNTSTLRDKLWSFGYFDCGLEQMSHSELKRLELLHREYDEVEYDLGWYDGTGPCYDMLHDLLNVPLKDARAAMKRYARETARRQGGGA